MLPLPSSPASVTVFLMTVHPTVTVPSSRVTQSTVTNEGMVTLDEGTVTVDEGTVTVDEGTVMVGGRSLKRRLFYLFFFSSNQIMVK